MKIKNKRLKTLSMVMAMVLTISNVLPLFTYAESITKNSIGSINMEDDGITIGVDETQSQKTTYSEELEILTEEDQTQGADVYVSQASTFGVFIPKVLTLDGKKNDEGLNKANYLVSLSETSNFAGNEKIKVVPEDSFVLHQLGKDDIQATVVQDKVEWLHNEIDIKGNGEVTATGMSAGSWNGVFFFNIKLESSNISSPTPNVLSLSEKNLFLGAGNSRQVNATLNGKNINSTATWISDNENILVNNGLIETKASAKVGDVATINVSAPVSSSTIDNLNAKGFNIKNLFVEDVYADETQVLTASLTVEIIDIVFTIDDQEITSVNIAPGNQVDVKANIVPENNDGVVNWSTNAVAGLNLIKNGNIATLKVADDMPIGNEYFILATSGTYSKLLKVVIVEGNTDHNHKFEEYLKETSWVNTNNGTYKFIQNDTSWTSNNYSKHNTTATSTWTIDIEKEIDYSLIYYVNSNTGDKLTITFDGAKIVNGKGGEVNNTIYKTTLLPGTHTLVASYVKDASANGGYDRATVYLESIKANHKCVHCNLIEEHTYSETIEVKEICDKNGIKKFTCECGYYYTEEIEAKHEYDMGKCIHCGEEHPDYDDSNLDVATPAEYFVFSLNEDRESYSVVCLTEAGQQLEEVIIPNYYNGKIVNAISDGDHTRYNYDNYSTAFATSNNGIEVDEIIENNILKEITIPGSIKRIGEDAFECCTNLSKVTIMDGVEIIGKNSFSLCPALGNIGPLGSKCSIEIPTSVTTFENSAFYNCYGIEKIELPEGVKTLNHWSFVNCTNLKTVELPNSLESIVGSTFLKCTNLKTIYIPKNCIYLGNEKQTDAATEYYLAVNQAFLDCSSTLKIYCEFTSKPSTWNKYWNAYYYDEVNGTYNGIYCTNVPKNIKTLSGVYWGITREQYNSTYEYQVN